MLTEVESTPMVNQQIEIQQAESEGGSSSAAAGSSSSAAAGSSSSAGAGSSSSGARPGPGRAAGGPLASYWHRVVARFNPGTNPSRDGVFSNLTAKPESNANKEEENPPPYDAAAADATPPYLETTIISPGMHGDEVLVEGLPVGNFFSFIWNLLVSMSFQFVGFLLTYLLHTSHAAKNGSRAGLGITLVQYGFYLRSRMMNQDGYPYGYKNHSNVLDGSKHHEWLSYVLMFLGWLIVIRSVTDYVRVKRLETMMQAPSVEQTV